MYSHTDRLTVVRVSSPWPRFWGVKAAKSLSLRALSQASIHFYLLMLAAEGMSRGRVKRWCYFYYLERLFILLKALGPNWEPHTRPPRKFPRTARHYSSCGGRSLALGARMHAITCECRMVRVDRRLIDEGNAAHLSAGLSRTVRTISSELGGNRLRGVPIIVDGLIWIDSGTPRANLAFTEGSSWASDREGRVDCVVRWVAGKGQTVCRCRPSRIVCRRLAALSRFLSARLVVADSSSRVHSA
jgi:hypothetical protein